MEGGRKEKMQISEQLDLLCHGTADVITREELRRKLERATMEGRPLRVKLGADPSAPDIHLGHTVPLRKLRQFQDLGHLVYFVIGDFTGRIGDPSGQSRTRRQLSEEEVQRNAETYREQVFKILDPDKTRVVFNNDWLGSLRFADVIKLASKYTVARMLERDDFQKRLRAEQPVSMHELLYPLAQAYDSVALRIDVELGGTDQTFNFLLTRDIQREYGLEPQVAITMPLLVGTDGRQKMSKSLGNYVAINDPPDEMYGKVMSLPDEVMMEYYRLTTDLGPAECDRIETMLRSGQLHPRDAKMKLAHRITALYHGREQADRAQEEFVRVFREGALPDHIPEVSLGSSDRALTAIDLLEALGAVRSRSQARRLIRQGAVRLDGVRVQEELQTVNLRDGALIQVGKRRFFRVRLS